jgi:hypothetical protein
MKWYFPGVLICNFPVTNLFICSVVHLCTLFYGMCSKVFVMDLWSSLYVLGIMVSLLDPWITNFFSVCKLLFLFHSGVLGRENIKYSIYGHQFTYCSLYIFCALYSFCLPIAWEDLYACFQFLCSDPYCLHEGRAQACSICMVLYTLAGSSSIVYWGVLFSYWLVMLDTLVFCIYIMYFRTSLSGSIKIPLIALKFYIHLGRFGSFKILSSYS